MRVLLQRVTEAQVKVDGHLVGQCGRGYLLLVGIGSDDTLERVKKMAAKIVKLRLFPNEAGKFDRSLLDIAGEALVVSQFTLMGDARKGNRPSFITAARPEHAAPLCDAFADALTANGIAHVGRGRFGADMQVSLVNDGPVTLMLEG